MAETLQFNEKCEGDSSLLIYDRMGMYARALFFEKLTDRTACIAKVPELDNRATGSINVREFHPNIHIEIARRVKRLIDEHKSEAHPSIQAAINEFDPPAASDVDSKGQHLTLSQKIARAAMQKRTQSP